MKNLFYISLCFLILTGIPNLSFSQQLPQFSQYMFNGLHINPAYAGYKSQGYIQSTFRSQWINLPGAPKTFSMTADFSANGGLMGFGVSLLSDQIGPTKTNSGLLSYAYRIRTGEDSYLSLGISAGANQYTLDGSDLLPVNPLDPDLNFDNQNLFTPNLNSGLFFHSWGFYAGISAFNLIGRKAFEREDISLALHDIHYYFTTGAMLPMTDVLSLKPSILVKYVEGMPISYDLNAMLLFYERLWLGASYRSNLRLGNDNSEIQLNNRNAIAVILEVFVTEDLRLGYAYDQNLNSLQNFRNDSHEISVGYYLSKRGSRIKNPRWF
ncbi:PorP/SprF family type IX secretion system membrane protein [Cecembia rubra]|uniref:Type IX secretion system PorP/SprF family membrane protein n=1 Tax=Cecembia rubra TaxID=1485585 RepID=A0A2P8EDL5_9BACT|nr:type IX secretion system membrane protein PorP/SprF [Cecembia rubra]PSL07579.1 type IX secretion system PorP/SprF family membrane protein [Cecembia rubra]